MIWLVAGIILLLWLFISMYVVLLGAEVNAETEAQTRVDTTVSPSKPVGARGAAKADQTAPPPSKSDHGRRSAHR